MSKFDQYFGENNHHIDPSYYHNGPISFAAYLHKRLDERLWAQITQLQVKRLWIIRPGQRRRSYDDIAPMTVVVLLDEHDLISDILFQPRYS